MTLTERVREILGPYAEQVLNVPFDPSTSVVLKSIRDYHVSQINPIGKGWEPVNWGDDAA